MASLTRWKWVWMNSGSWWWTGRPGVLQFLGSQSRTRLSDWTELIAYAYVIVTCSTYLSKLSVCWIQLAFSHLWALQKLVNTATVYSHISKRQLKHCHPKEDLLDLLFYSPSPPSPGLSQFSSSVTSEPPLQHFLLHVLDAYFWQVWDLHKIPWLKIQTT